MLMIAGGVILGIVGIAVLWLILTAILDLPVIAIMIAALFHK